MNDHVAVAAMDSSTRADSRSYLSGFGNHFASEAIAGTLPEGRNSPQRVAHGLYAEQISGTAFTAPRHENRRSWLYRLRPSAEHPPFTRYESAVRLAPGTVKEPLAPNRLRWDPVGGDTGVDLIDGMTTGSCGPTTAVFGMRNMSGSFGASPPISRACSA